MKQKPLAYYFYVTTNILLNADVFRNYYLEVNDAKKKLRIFWRIIVLEKRKAFAN